MDHLPRDGPGAESFLSQRCWLHQSAALVKVVARRSHVVDRTVVGGWDALVDLVSGNYRRLEDDLSRLRVARTGCSRCVNNRLLHRPHSPSLGHSDRNLKAIDDSLLWDD